MHPLCTAREARGLTMRSLAELLTLGKGGHRRVFEWEHGTRVPSRVFAKELAEQLGFESGDIVRQLCRDWQAEQAKGENYAFRD